LIARALRFRERLIHWRGNGRTHGIFRPKNVKLRCVVEVYPNEVDENCFQCNNIDDREYYFPIFTAAIYIFSVKLSSVRNAHILTNFKL
jgi:hypothetical protein